MIRPAEIQRIAGTAKVRDTQIEKDYILSWILIGISHDEVLRKALLFKGGTVLKKFYFKDYRYSEDLDFTLADHSLTPDDVRLHFELVMDFVAEEANIHLSINDFNIHSTGNIYFYLQYVGPLGGSGENKKVKVDISTDEHICYPIEERTMFKTFSDEQPCCIQCYSLDEVMVEKLRSLISRTQPRDYYDLWYLCEQEDMDMAFHKPMFEQKCLHKGIDAQSLEDKLNAKLDNFKARWSQSMKDQIFDLPPFEQIHRELSRHFKRFFK